MIRINERLDNILFITTTETLSLGARVKVDDLALQSYYGYVVPLGKKDQYEVRFKTLPQTLDTQSIASVIWWRKSYKSTYVIDPTIFTASETTCRLEAECARSEEGYLNWELYFNTSLIARGNDMETPGWCMFTTEGLFPAGAYYLEIKQQYLNMTIGRGSAHWTVLEPTALLESGMGKAVGRIEVR